VGVEVMTVAILSIGLEGGKVKEYRQGVIPYTL
jgi:hypothetical protein